MGKFAKGVSGNPGGRPKVIGQVRDIARVHSDAAINTLVEVMKDSIRTAAGARCRSDATDFFQIRTGRVVEVGTQVTV